MDEYKKLIQKFERLDLLAEQVTLKSLALASRICKEMKEDKKAQKIDKHSKNIQDKIVPQNKRLKNDYGELVKLFNEKEKTKDAPQNIKEIIKLVKDFTKELEKSKKDYDKVLQLNGDRSIFPVKQATEIMHKLDGIREDVYKHSGIDKKDVYTNIGVQKFYIHLRRINQGVYDNKFRKLLIRKNIPFLSEPMKKGDMKNLYESIEKNKSLQETIKKEISGFYDWLIAQFKDLLGKIEEREKKIAKEIQTQASAKREEERLRYRRETEKNKLKSDILQVDDLDKEIRRIN